MSNSKLENQKAAVKNWFKEVLNVESNKEIKQIIKEFCQYTGFRAPRTSSNKEIRQTRWENWRFQWTIKRWPMFELWIREEVRRAQVAQSEQKEITTPADALVNNMIKV
jgi:hypothetical protein